MPSLGGVSFRSLFALTPLIDAICRSYKRISQDFGPTAPVRAGESGQSNQAKKYDPRGQLPVLLSSEGSVTQAQETIDRSIP